VPPMLEQPGRFRGDLPLHRSTHLLFCAMGCGEFNH
jgi:hypothetical protein